MMENQIDIMKRTVELSETCLEGIEHIQSKLNEGYFVDTIILFKDVVDAYYYMERSIHILSNQLKDHQLEELTVSLLDALNHVVTSYENAQEGKALEIIQFNLLPNYKKWKAELEQTFAPYLVS